MEILLSGAICGVMYALFAGQPLTLVGATGPLIVFEAILYQICKYVLEIKVCTNLSFVIGIFTHLKVRL
jgi:MFS superfamily sulfate permease-like transporter